MERLLTVKTRFVSEIGVMLYRRNSNFL